MGNEGSQLKGLEIEEKAIEVTDFWSHHQATVKDSCRYFSLKGDGSVSVFKGEIVLGPLWTSSTPLEKYSNNLLKYRHPCIVRYISAWQQRSTHHLATEYVQPLSHALCSQTPLQICIGLHNILRALVFLHEQGGVSHNNVCLSAVYVTGDGQWKLGGLQYLCTFSELTAAYLKHARIYRYDKAVDPNEESYEINAKVDQYGFAVLVEDSFKNFTDDDVPHLREFKSYCREFLQHNDLSTRPSLSEALHHNFFNHDFISIYKFLNFLPLKTEEEKQDFFANIIGSLKCYDEETAAKQFTGLLLSRHTMLDPTAKTNVIPFILKPKNERLQNGEHAGVFSLPIYKEYVKPRLLQLFSVRDIQIRMLLLTHFSKIIHVFTHEELSQHILPELLLGIKDTDDNLVASTLICLSELVPILGANTVIGGKRSKLFSDGRPKTKTNVFHATHQPQKEYTFSESEDIYKANDSILGNVLTSNERPSPVGGESLDDEIMPESKTKTLPEIEDDWIDWDNTNRGFKDIDTSNVINDIEQDFNVVQPTDTSYLNKLNIINIAKLPDQTSVSPTLLHKAALEAKKNIVDIAELDIKNQKYDNSKNGDDEIDFFADMTPVIEKQAIAVVDTLNKNGSSTFSNLNFVPDENEIWGDNWDE